MLRRKLLWLVAIAAAVAAVAIPWPENGPYLPNLSYEKLLLIKPGTSRAQVIEILGVSPGDFRTGPTEYESEIATIAIAPQAGNRVDVWLSDTIHIYVAYDSSDRARDSTCLIDRSAKRERLDDLLWRTKRLWHRWFP